MAAVISLEAFFKLALTFAVFATAAMYWIYGTVKAPIADPLPSKMG
jgi:hypothetical protein